MILFCDSSALVKLYVEEAFSPLMRRVAEQAAVIGVARIAWAEVMAALARRVRERPADARATDVVRMRLRTDWSDFAQIEITQPLVELAGDYADTFALRGYDSVQLAAARTLQQSTDDEFCFACFDARLLKAAKVLNLRIPEGI